MSSESDTEEFFDAQDVTPIVTRTVPSHGPEARSQSEEGNSKSGLHGLLNIEDEEKRVFEIQKLANERRLKEEEEIQRRLAEIELWKAEEAERKKAEERCVKLEAIRQSVDLTYNRPQAKPSNDFTPCRQSSPDVDKLSRENPVLLSAQKRSKEAEDIQRSTRQPVDQSFIDKSAISMGVKHLPENFMNTNDTINRNRPANIEINKVPSKNIPEVVIGGVRLEDNATMESILAPEQDATVSSEPDIVQSTKTSSLNRTGEMPPPQPVAPPRRKKVQSAGPLSDVSPNLEQPNSSMTGSLLSDSESKVINLTAESSRDMPGTDDGSEPILDINSATKGNRVVTVIEDNSEKSDSEEELVPDHEKKETVKAEIREGREKSTMKLKLEISRTGNDGINYSIPLSMSRPRSCSGSRYLSDKEILDQVFVLNLDTGETVPLSSAEEKLPKCINPLSLHIMRRTKEYSSDSNLYKGDQSDDEGTKGSSRSRTVKTVKPLKKRKLRLKKFFKTRIKDKIKSVKGGHGDESTSDDEEASDGRSMIKVKASNSNKGPYEFDMLVPLQDLAGQRSGAVWTMKFSHCGRLLATGGQDNLLRVWILKDAYSYFNDLRQKYNEGQQATAKTSPTASQDSLNSQPEGHSSDSAKPEEEEEMQAGGTGGDDDDDDAEYLPFMKQPFCIYRGHSADLLDISWSKNYFILSSSMDKTVRLWHISRRECLCCFQHIDFVTAIAFHPKDDRYFLSGSLDGKLRLWNIPDKKVALWNEVSNGTKLITAANFCLNGQFAVVGTYDGRCVFYNTEQLKYFTQIHVRSTRGKNARGRKITGVEPFPGEDKILVTSNDSRIRLYDLRDLTLSCKYKGCANNSSQIKASFSHDGKFIICGSEDQYIYIWKTQHDFYKFHSARRDRNVFWEGIKAHSAVVTNAIFAPNPQLIIKPQFQYIDLDDKENTEAGQGEVLVSADYTGHIKIFINKFKPGCS